jgi:hypothetical protein
LFTLSCKNATRVLHSLTLFQTLMHIELSFIRDLAEEVYSGYSLILVLYCKIQRRHIW